MRRESVSVWFIGAALAMGVCLHAVAAEAKPVKFVQPFQITFDRHDVHVIAWMQDNPRYDAIEAFVTNREGQEPLIRVTMTELDGYQNDLINDQALADERAALFTGRTVLYRPVSYQHSLLPDDAPRVTLSFTSSYDEEIYFDLSALFPSVPSQGGLTDPGNHALCVSLPVMYRDGGTVAGYATELVIDGTPQPIPPGPFAGALNGYYTNGFHIGVIRASEVELELLWGPTQVREGRSWFYLDPLGRVQSYDIIQVDGDVVMIRKSTGMEEIITAKLGTKRKDVLDILNVRLTGVPASLNQTPPAPTGFTLDLSVPEQFSLSIDQQANLVTGYADSELDRHGGAWFLVPEQPTWAVPRNVDAQAEFHRHFVSIVNTIGASCEQ
jgi:hypothetical protein